MNGDDAGVVESGHGLRFALEPLAPFGVARGRDRQELERHEPVQPRVARLIHFAHTARAEGGDDFVRTETRAGGERQSGWII